LKQKSDSPRFLGDEVTVQMGEQIGSPIVSRRFSWSSVDTNIDFDRKSLVGFTYWRISRVNVPSDDSPQAIVRMFKRKIEQCKSIKSEDYPDGIGIKKIPFE
jgi:hypothetical protein